MRRRKTWIVSVVLLSVVLGFGGRVWWYYSNSVRLQNLLDHTRVGMTRDEVTNLVRQQRLDIMESGPDYLAVMEANGPLNAVSVHYRFDTSGTVVRRQVGDADSLVLPYFAVHGID